MVFSCLVLFLVINKKLKRKLPKYFLFRDLLFYPT
nr:MAG TPA: hypothetical protein [Myoviridae sp. ct5lt7]